MIWVAAIIKDDKKILFGKRLSKHWEGTWWFPGWKIEFQEKLEAWLAREVFEEIWAKVLNSKFIAFTEDIFDNNKHYITFFYEVEIDSLNIINKEKTKTDEWRWFNKGEIPENLFLPIKNLLSKWFLL